MNITARIAQANTLNAAAADLEGIAARLEAEGRDAEVAHNAAHRLAHRARRVQVGIDLDRGTGRVSEMTGMLHKIFADSAIR